MKVIYKNNSIDEPVREDPSIEISSSMAVVLKRLRNEDEVSERGHQAQALLAAIHVRGRWIACDCLGDISQPPIFCLEQRNSRVTLRRLTGRPLHAPQCACWFTPKEVRDKEDAKLKSEKSLGENPNLLILLNYAAETTPDTFRQIGDPEDPVPERRPKLAKVLFHLLQSAGLNTLASHDPMRQMNGRDRVIESRNRLETVIRGMFIDGKGRKIPLGDFFRFSFIDRLEQLKHLLSASAQRAWPKSKRPMGYFLAVAEDVAGEHIILKNDGASIHVKAKLSKYGRDNATTGAPYLVLCAISCLPEQPDRFEVLHAYAHPIYSKSDWVPVDSDYERQVLTELLKIQRWLRERKHLEIKIIKPLQAISVNFNGEQVDCRPDFLIRDIDEKLEPTVIEVMGYETQEYWERKSVTLPRMASLGRLFEIPAYRRASGESMVDIVDTCGRQIIAHVLDSYLPRYGPSLLAGYSYLIFSNFGLELVQGFDTCRIGFIYVEIVCF